MRRYDERRGVYVYDAKIGTGPSSLIVVKYPCSFRAGARITFRKANDPPSVKRTGIIDDVDSFGRIFITLH